MVKIGMQFQIATENEKTKGKVEWEVSLQS